MARRSDALSIAVLGLLHDTPLHGYELRKRLDVLIGPLRRRISFGSLYPALRDLQARGWITAAEEPAAAPGLPSRRSRVVYRLTPPGQARLAELLAVSGPPAWEDEQFDVRFAFFGRTDAETRLRILEGRRTRMQERLERVRSSMARTYERLDAYAAELQRHGLESVEREVRWLDDLIERERAARSRRAPDPGAPPGTTPSPSTPSGPASRHPHEE
ncbi:PadR family transcriptional regulator [Quadrisphaera sp. DSM 44207]|uniref:PadR family transcriptional regulator n=1 Tax=Quadrisphaera sp. DSM 44207 TaxID=1881057 RepID=UPI000888CC0D|nr:PadR family transcriptional regulator [Quadrisphaera sp. DSM 44207]SDQ23586.1 transcriptional regulator, PadR family [Quadrisphaera sp. DSM 44207]